MKRSRLVALLGALALVGVFTIGSAATVLGTDVVKWATVTDHAAGGPDNNHEDTWEKLTGLDCTKPDIGNLGSTYLLSHDYALVIVKAGSDQSADDPNTLFANAKAGETVWADSNGSNAYDEGDKGISHIIFCNPAPQETPAATPEVTPEATPEVTPEATPEVTPEATPEVTPEATPEVTPEATPAETPEGTPAETPAETPEATPAETPEGTPAETPPGGGGVLGETNTPGNPTGPSTDISTNDSVPGGVNMGIVLLALGALAVVTLLVTPVPAKIRERGRRK